VEKVYGQARAGMEAVLGWQDLRKELATLPPRDQILRIDLTGRDPDEGMTDIPYEKGALFLRHLEEVFGRERFDAFLKGYFNHFAFQSITTAEFAAYLKKNLLDANPAQAAQVPLDEWLYEPGVPRSAPKLASEAMAKVEQQAQEWLSGKSLAADLPARAWSTQEWLHFLRALPLRLATEKMHQLDAAFKLTDAGNAEIVNQWLLLAIRNQYAPAEPRLEQFLTSMGRRKFLQPLYAELVKTPGGKERALKIYRRARPTYHPIAVATVDEIVGWGK
jgi:hypothetical protein